MSNLQKSKLQNQNSTIKFNWFSSWQHVNKSITLRDERTRTQYSAYLQGGRWANYWGSWVDLQNVNRVIDISFQTKDQYDLTNESFDVKIFNDLIRLLSDMVVKSKSGRILMIEVSSKLKFHKEALKKQGIMKKCWFCKKTLKRWE